MKNDIVYIDMCGLPIAIIKPLKRKIKRYRKRKYNKIGCIIYDEKFKNFKESGNYE